MKPINFDNGVSIEVQERDGLFLGLGEVVVEGTALRSSRRPMFVDIRNPWGVHLVNYRVVDEHRSGEEVRLRFAMDQVADGPMDWHLHECRPMKDVGDWSAGPRPAEGTTLDLVLKPLSREIGVRKAVGFSYRYEYDSTHIPIYLIEDRGTWELGESAIGSQQWLRNGNCPSLHTFSSRDEHISSEWYLDSCTNSNIFQFLPLQTHLQGFTMVVNEDGALLTWCPRASHIRTLIEKPRGTEDLVHRHEHCGDLGLSFNTQPMEVLFVEGKLDAVDRANLYGAMIDLVYDVLHRDIGLAREYVPAYGQIEEWTDADLVLYREQGLPALADAGMQHIELANHCQNNMNTWGVSNMCGTVDYKIAASVGEDKLAAFCRDAAARGMTVGMWANTSLSSLTKKFAQTNGAAKGIDFLPYEGSIMEALDRSDRPFVINSFGAIEADHYTPEFCVLNIRDTVVRDYWLKRWGHLAREVGLGGIFLDSSFNLSSDKFDWRFNAHPEAARGATADQTQLLGGQRPETAPPSSIESMYHAHLTLIAEMQKMGYHYCGEDSGVFGVHRNGPDITARLDNLHMWNDFVAEFDAAAVRAKGYEPRDVFFQGLAYRLMWRLCWHVPSRTVTFNCGGARGEEDLPTDWHIARYEAYTKALPFMRTRTTLPGERGVRYDHEGATVLWAFEDVELDLGRECAVEDLTEGTETSGTTIEGVRYHVYLARTRGRRHD